MSSIDYIAKCQRYRRYQVVASVCSIVAFGAAVVMSAWVRDGCDSFACVLGVLLTATLIGGVMIYTHVLGPQKRARTLGLLCPSCSKPLVAMNGFPDVVAGNCRHCAVQVLDSL